MVVNVKFILGNSTVLAAAFLAENFSPA